MDKKLFLLLRNNVLHSLWIKGKESEYGHLTLQETYRQSIVAHLASFKLKGAKKVMLIVPREEILSQEFDFASEGANVKELMRQKLDKVFPYKLNELTYGVRSLNQADGRIRGQLTAVPREKLQEWTGPLEEAGLLLDDVVASDESAARLVMRLKDMEGRRALVLDFSDLTVECLLLDSRNIRLSRVFRRDTPNLFKEIGLITLGVEGFDRIYVCGSMPDAQVYDAAAELRVEVEKIELPIDQNGKMIPAALAGMMEMTEEAPVSLLPHEKKEEKRKERVRQALKDFALGMTAALVAFAGFFAVHLFALELKLDGLKNRNTTGFSEVAAIAKKHDILLEAETQALKNKMLLDILETVASASPQNMTVTRLQVDERMLFLQGKSGDNVSIADFLNRIKESKNILNPKLEYTRRSRAESDNAAAFDFLIKAERVAS